MLGFIISKDVHSIPKKACNYLTVQKTYVECVCPSKEFCFHEVLDVFCPFYETVNVPWDIKQLFLTRRNPLLAIARLSDLEQILKNFLGQFYVNHF